MVGYRKRHLFGVLFFLFVLSMLFCPRMVAQAADGRLEIGLSSKEPQVGESLTVTLFAVDGSGGRASADMTLSYDTDVLSFESCDAEGSSGGDGTVTASGRVVTIQFTVIGEGKASLGLKGANGKSVSTQEALDSMAPAGTTVTAVASGGASSGGGSGSGGGNTSSGGDAGSGDGDASSGGDSGSGDGGASTGGTSSDGAGESGQDGGEDGPKSKDNSLSELSLSVGELSPTFSPSTIEYTAVVPYEVTKVEVTAKTSNPNAEIEAILGNQNLKVGENEITLTIRAENGGRVVYRIKVTRQDEEDATPQGGEADGAQGDGTGTDTAPQDGDAASDGTSADGAGESGQGGEADGTQGDGTGTGTAPQDGDTASDGTSADGAGESGQDVGTDEPATEDGTVSYEEQLALLDQEYGKLQSKYQEEKRLAQRTILIMALVIVVLVFLLLNRTLFSRKNRTEEEEYWEEPRQKRSRKEKKPKRERDPEKEKKPKHKRKDGQEKDTGQDGEMAGTDEVIDLDDL